MIQRPIRRRRPSRQIQAKADAEAKYLAARASRQRQAIMTGLRESVNSFKSEVSDVDAKQCST